MLLFFCAAFAAPFVQNDSPCKSVTSSAREMPKDKSRFFAHHPRTYPKEQKSLFGAPKTFGVPFAQNDIVIYV